MDKPTVIITGSSIGIGAGLAEFFADNNFLPIITYNTHAVEAEKLVEKLKEKSHEAISIHLNLKDPQSIKDFVAKVNMKISKLDLLICNAGSDYYHESLNEIELEEWREIFGVKLFGTFLCVRDFLPLLKKSQNPNIIMISSSLAERPDDLDPVYSCACAAVNNLSKSFAKGLAKHDIRTNVVCPGSIDTNLQYWREIKKKTPNIFVSFKKTSPLRMLIEPKDIGSVILSIYVNKVLTGNVIYASGGTQLL